MRPRRAPSASGGAHSALIIHRFRRITPPVTENMNVHRTSKKPRGLGAGAVIGYHGAIRTGAVPVQRAFAESRLTSGPAGGPGVGLLRTDLAMSMKRSTSPRAFLTPEECAAVEEALGQAEASTSAELKVVIARHSWGDIRVKAARLFEKYGLDQTELRNCAMILVVPANREYLIYGDNGIHEKVGQGFWTDVRDLMAQAFQEGRFGDGLRDAVLRTGVKLAEHFPIQDDDRNEISDEIVYES